MGEFWNQWLDSYPSYFKGWFVGISLAALIGWIIGFEILSMEWLACIVAGAVVGKIVGIGLWQFRKEKKGGEGWTT